VKVYEVPFVRPVTVQVVLAVVQVKPPGDAVARYDVTAEPFAAAALPDTGTCVFWPLVAVTPVGVPGVVYGVAELEAVLADPTPLAFVARTVNV
jgi:hypothetical protein